jgi:NAD(P)-dependent dehydrogenase (short-subunit alcohol dehydrogenase family)
LLDGESIARPAGDLGVTSNAITPGSGGAAISQPATPRLARAERDPLGREIWRCEPGRPAGDLGRPAAIGRVPQVNSAR